MIFKCACSKYSTLSYQLIFVTACSTFFSIFFLETDSAKAKHEHKCQEDLSLLQTAGLELSKD